MAENINTPSPENASHGISFAKAFEFAHRAEISDKVAHVFGTILGTVSFKLHFYLESEEQGGEAFRKKMIESGKAIGPEVAKAIILDLINAILKDPQISGDKTQDMKDYWFGINGTQTESSATPDQLFSTTIGTPESPWNPFTELGI